MEVQFVYKTAKFTCDGDNKNILATWSDCRLVVAVVGGPDAHSTMQITRTTCTDNFKNFNLGSDYCENV